MTRSNTTATARTMLAMPRIRPGRIIAGTLLFLGGLLMITPILFMFSTSFKSSDQIYDLRLMPAAPTLANYVKVLSNGDFIRWFLNSSFVSITVEEIGDDEG